MAGGILLPSVVRSASGTQALGDTGDGTVQSTGLDPSRCNLMAVQFNVTASVAPTSLNLYFQHSFDGTVWDDFISFTQVGAVGSLRQIAQWDRDAVSASADRTAGDAALAAGTVINGPTGPLWRLKWVMVGTSYTFSVIARQIQRTR